MSGQGIQTETRKEAGSLVGTPIDYQRVYVERVVIHLTAPEEPGPSMVGFDLLHGYLCEIYRLRSRDPQFGPIIDSLCQKWNVIYKNH